MRRRQPSNESVGSRVPPSQFGPYQQRLLAQARTLASAPPPPPWGAPVIIPGAGIVANGWDAHEDVLLISHEGYSLTAATTGRRLLRDHDGTLLQRAFSWQTLDFVMPTTGETVRTFGIFGGDGIHVTRDDWSLEVIAPWWPLEIVVLWPPRNVRASGEGTFLDGAQSLAVPHVDTTSAKCGFSPSGRRFMVAGSAGAVVYSRP